MPNIKSAKKRVKTDLKKKLKNKDAISSMRTAIKNAKLASKGTDVTVATDAMKTAIKKIDKAAANGLIHKNKAAREKSRIMKAVNTIK